MKYSGGACTCTVPPDTCCRACGAELRVRSLCRVCGGLLVEGSCVACGAMSEGVRAHAEYCALNA